MSCAHASGLNAGRWDYLFSMIKYFRDAGEYVLPDRSAVRMTTLHDAYAELLVKTCHQRGRSRSRLAAFIPSRRDSTVNARHSSRFVPDKTRERTRVSTARGSPSDLVPVCREVFDSVWAIGPTRSTAGATMCVSRGSTCSMCTTSGEITTEGVRLNVDVGIRYLADWLRGQGAAAIHNLMEDAATAEISRSQLWQWVRNGSRLDDGTLVTAELVRSVIEDQMTSLGPDFGQARKLFEQVALADEFVDFLTIPAYDAVP
jgi:malate synthase